MREVPRKIAQRTSALAQAGDSEHYGSMLHESILFRFRLRRLVLLTFSFPLVNSMKDAFSSSSPSSSLMSSRSIAFSDSTSSILALRESSFAKDHKM